MMRAVYLCEAAEIAERAPEGATRREIAELIRAAARRPEPRPNLDTSKWRTAMGDIFDDHGGH